MVNLFHPNSRVGNLELGLEFPEDLCPKSNHLSHRGLQGLGFGEEKIHAVPQNLFRNLSWLLFGGLLSSVGLLFAQFFYTRSVILVLLKLPSALAMTIPFKLKVEKMDELIPGDGFLDPFFNGVWFFTVGWLLVLNHLFFGTLLTLSILGLPLARQHWKLLKYSAFPFGKMLSPVDLEATEVDTKLTQS